MEILHVSAECYPVAKAGGLGDVVGALPKYQCKAGHYAKVVMPMYRTKFLYNNSWVVDSKGSFFMGSAYLEYTVIKERTNKLGFDLYLVEIAGLTDREKVYGYNDDIERFVAFQIAVLTWLNQWQHIPNIIHCHDHHTALIPFMMQHCYDFQKLKYTKSILTIHNAQYQGWFGWNKSYYLPRWDNWKSGLLEWNNTINSLACGVKCATKVTTVSWSYLNEMRIKSNGLEALFEYEKGKCSGILNGIDTEVWNPYTDTYIAHHYQPDAPNDWKQKNKEALCQQFGFNKDLPLIIFIGRLVGEKAADVLPDALLTALYRFKNQFSILILGSGDPHLEWRLKSMKANYNGYTHTEIGYNEALAHTMYAGADFLLMPSRVEPCGLNQMYALRYGTLPMVRRTGGLQDTVVDMGEWQGFGILFNHATIDDINHAIGRAINVYYDKTHFHWMRQHMMHIDHSWEQAIQQYDGVYR